MTKVGSTLSAEAATKRFMERLESGYYNVSRSPNSGEDFSKETEALDAKAREEFLSSELAKEIKGMV